MSELAKVKARKFSSERSSIDEMFLREVRTDMHRDRVFIAWSHWLRGGFLKPRTACASAERMYQSGESFDDERATPCESLLAQSVEQAVCSLPSTMREVVRAHFYYHSGVPAEFRHRKTGLKASVYASHLRIGRMRVLAQVIE